MIKGTGFLSCRLDVLVGIAVPDDFSGHAVHRVFEAVFLQFALPDDDDRPALCLKLAPDFLVAFLVPGHLGRPELGIGLGNRIELAVPVAVPEATVDEDDRAVLWKDNIRRSGQSLVVDQISEPKMPQRMTQLQLRLRRRGVNSCHVTVALVWSMHIRHRKRVIWVLLLSANLSLYLHKSPINCNER